MKSDWERLGIHTADAVVEYFQTDFENNPAKERRILFYKVVESFVAAYYNISDYIIRAGFTQEEARRIHLKVCEAASLRLRVKQASEEDFDVKTMDSQMRQLLDRFIRADEADAIIPATADFSFLDLLTAKSDTDEAVKKATKQAGGSKKAAAEKILAKDRIVINDWRKKDKAQGESFAKRLQEIIDQMHQTTEETATTIRKLIELLKVMHEHSLTPTGVDSDFAKALWNNRNEWTDVADQTELIGLIHEIEVYFQTKVFDGWKDITKAAGVKCIKGLRKVIGSISKAETPYVIHNIAANNL